MSYFDHNDELVIDQYDLYDYEESHGMLPYEPKGRYQMSHAEIRDLYDTRPELSIRELARIVEMSESKVKAILLEEI